jgi:hypothetical protein
MGCDRSRDWKECSAMVKVFYLDSNHNRYLRSMISIDGILLFLLDFYGVSADDSI